MAIKDSIKNASLLCGTLPNTVQTNSNVPPQYKDRQHRYFEKRSVMFNEIMGKYTTDYFQGRIQGLDVNAPYDYTPVKLRMADVVKKSAFINRNFDDYKICMIMDRRVEYLRIGSKLEAMGNTWLVINVANMSGNGEFAIERCNALYRTLDYYGNIISEPICFARDLMSANDSDPQKSVLIPKGYFNMRCQYNDVTAQLDTNTRLILGKSAYRITGYANFETEFTDDIDSVRTLYFTVRVEEPNLETDDMVNKVAGGLTFSWNLNIVGNTSAKIGETSQLSVESRRMGELVESTDEKPISYLWESSDESIATVDDNGVVTAVAVGNCTITAKLAQNEAITTSVEFAVTEVSTESYVEFDGDAPKSLGLYKSITLSATYYENGSSSKKQVEYEFSGADSSKYSVKANKNKIKITCFGGSVVPLKIVAKYGDHESSIEINLEGF